MNFSFTGPQFLAFYTFLAVAANGLLRYLLSRSEARPVASIRFAQDQYRIAYLRAGSDEAIRVAMFSLVDRGLLEESKGSVRCAKHCTAANTHRPLEQAILNRAADWTTFTGISSIGQANVRAAVETYREELEEEELIAGSACEHARSKLRQTFIWPLLAISVLRIVNAITQGRYNIGFLIILTVAALLFLQMAGRKRLTQHGAATLARLEVLFTRLRRNADRLQPGGQTTDAVLLFAIFGFGALPAVFQAHYVHLFPAPAPTLSSSGNSSSSGSGGGCSGSSSSSCGGSGCGGGCGGGGCGG